MINDQNILEGEGVVTETFEPAAPARPTVPERFTAADLQAMQFAPPRWIVPNFIPEGLAIIAGRPKLGKSWLCLDIALAVAGGRYVLDNRHCEEGDALYLALEDNARRLRNRVGKLLPAGETWPSRLTFWLQSPRCDDGGLKAIRQWVTGTAKPRLIIIDVLTAFRNDDDGRNAYRGDYAALRGLHALASEFGIAALVVHHTRKGGAGSDGDPFEAVSGTLGLVGAADTTLVLDRTSSGSTIYARGRDLETMELAVEFNPTTCRWTVKGDADEVRRSGERHAVLDVLKRATEPMTPADIAAETGAKLPSLKVLLGRMVKDAEIVRTARGRYQHPGRHDLKPDAKVTDAEPPGYLAALALKGNC